MAPRPPPGNSRQNKDIRTARTAQPERELPSSTAARNPRAPTTRTAGDVITLGKPADECHQSGATPTPTPTPPPHCRSRPAAPPSELPEPTRNTRRGQRRRSGREPSEARRPPGPNADEPHKQDRPRQHPARTGAQKKRRARRPITSRACGMSPPAPTRLSRSARGSRAATARTRPPGTAGRARPSAPHRGAAPRGRRRCRRPPAASERAG